MEMGKCEEVEPLPPSSWPPWDTQQSGPSRVWTLGKAKPSYSFLPSPNPDRRDGCRGSGGSFLSTTVCSTNNSHQGLLLQETEGKETFICPSAQCGHCHRSGTNGVWRGGEGRGKGGTGSLSKLGGCSQRRPGAEPLCVCVSTPLLSTPVPAEMHSRHKQPQAGLLQGRLDLLLVQFTARQPLPLVPSTRTADSLCCPWLLLTPNVVLGPEWQLTISMQGKTQA